MDDNLREKMLQEWTPEALRNIPAGVSITPNQPRSIDFIMNGKSVISIKEDGIYYKGVRLDVDDEAVRAFESFFLSVRPGIHNEERGQSVSHKIIHVSIDDWEAVYVDGALEYEGHNIPTHILLNLMAKYKLFDENYESYYIEDELYSDEIGLYGFPKSLEDIPEEVLVD